MYTRHIRLFHVVSTMTVLILSNYVIVCVWEGGGGPDTKNVGCIPALYRKPWIWNNAIMNLFSHFRPQGLDGSNHLLFHLLDKDKDHVAKIWSKSMFYLRNKNEKQCIIA